MNQELTRRCPECEEDRAFTLVARTNLHLGVKTKWSCPECDYGFVKIDETVDTSTSAEA